jgi:hypothetical protein
MSAFILGWDAPERLRCSSLDEYESPLGCSEACIARRSGALNSHHHVATVRFFDEHESSARHLGGTEQRDQYK